MSPPLRFRADMSMLRVQLLTSFDSVAVTIVIGLIIAPPQLADDGQLHHWQYWPRFGGWFKLSIDPMLSSIISTLGAIHWTQFPSCVCSPIHFPTWELLFVLPRKLQPHGSKDTDRSSGCNYQNWWLQVGYLHLDPKDAMAMVFKIISPALLKNQFLVLLYTENWHRYPHDFFEIFSLILLYINAFD